jgi:Zn-dependent protease/predicted RNA-binding Zn-ribbon protein involved in translation (DUF1610 family)
MFKKGGGSFRLFQVFGINVWLHWSWFLVAAYSLDKRKGYYHSPVWSIAEYLVLFFIVMLHEFGHALACKQTGGQADTIILWPLGGIAFVQPPNRPGAQLWSLAAGPLVNVALVPVFLGAGFFASQTGLYHDNPDLHRFLYMVALINLVLLCFNMLPIYPLDGGQILRSLLWFGIGPVRSLYTAVVIGFIGAGGMAFYALSKMDYWLGLIALFAASRCWAGFQQAKVLGKIHALPRHTEFACPACGEAPIVGEFWGCRRCLKPFDTFVTGARCPQCNEEFTTTKCPSCHRSHPIAAWRVGGPPPLR